MSLSPTSRQVVLKEVFDEASVPTDEEIYDYAVRIGIDIETESHLLYIARDGLMQALPPGWKPCYDKDKKEIYYFNFKTKKAQWEHPLDEAYRNLVKKARTESQLSEQVDDDSRTEIKEELKSYEEASLILTSSEMYNKAKKLEPLSPMGKGVFKKIPAVLSPIKRSNSKEILKSGLIKSPLHIDEEKLFQRNDNENLSKKLIFDETEVRKRPNSSDIRNRRNIGPVEFRHLSKQEIIPNPLEKLNFLTETRKLLDNKILIETPSIEAKGSESAIATRDEGYGTEFSVSSLGEREMMGKKELTLIGGGSVFLKSNKMKTSPSSDLVTSSFSREELSDGLLSPDVRKSGSDIDSHPKSILREQKLNEKTVIHTVEKRLRKDDLDDERKSVRFNLEKEIKVTFEIPHAIVPDSENANTFVEKVTPKIEKELTSNPKEENRQIEVDFDELNLNFSDDKSEKVEETVPIESTKTAEPKKFKPSQMLVKEFREIFENQSKPSINLFNISKAENFETLDVKSSRCSSSRSVTSQSDDNPQSSQQLKSSARGSEETISSQISKLGNVVQIYEKESPKLLNDKLKMENLNSTLDDLIDYAVKKKLDIDISKDQNSSNQILYPEKDILLEEILKENDSESLEESLGDNICVTEDRELKYLDNLEAEINLSTKNRKSFEEAIENYEKMKNNKLLELERDYIEWQKELENRFEKKKEEEETYLEEKFKKCMKDRFEEMEELCKKKCEEESQNRCKELKNDFLKKSENELEKLKVQLSEELEEKLQNYKKDIEAKYEEDLNILSKTYEDKLAKKKEEIMNKHKEEIIKIERDLDALLLEKKVQIQNDIELEKMKETMRFEMKENYHEQKNLLTKEHEMLLKSLKQEQALAIEQLKIEFKNEEESLRLIHLNRMEDFKRKVEESEKLKTIENQEAHRAEVTEARVFEKVRCEKRLLEDKYKTLKEKYVKLKAEAKSTLERKKKKKDSSDTTGSETKKSSSYKTNPNLGKGIQDSPSIQSKLEAEKKLKFQKHINNLDYLYHEVSTEDEENLMSPKNLPCRQKYLEASDAAKKQMKNEEKRQMNSENSEKLKEESSGEEKKAEGNESKKKRQLFSRFKAASTSRISSNNKNQGKEVLSPVENLRRQLKKLEELEDQFPVTTYTDTYMRYPFTDNAQFGSSEIEFFKHRIHLERESVRRAKDSLKAQKKIFENRKRELKQKMVELEPGSKSFVDQIYQEEKELTDMEVSVHRTRVLLGEKIIRLRHLEQSLKRISQPLKKDSLSAKGKDFLGRLGVRYQSKEEDKTLSDLSSYSGSSGFSSTDFNDTHHAIGSGKKFSTLEQSRRHFQANMQESSEIIQSLENLNSEIREIWEVLKKQHQSGQETITLLPPPPLIYGDLGCHGFTLSPPLPFRNTVITSTSNLQRPMAQQFKTQVTGSSNFGHVSTIIDSSIIDRARSLRDWLKAARSSTPSDVINPSQVTL